MPAEPLPVLLLPGLDGTGRLFARFLAAATGALDLRVVCYPPHRALGYEALLDFVGQQLPRLGRWALLAESFSGPLGPEPDHGAVGGLPPAHRRLMAPRVGRDPAPMGLPPRPALPFGPGRG
jgi:hypothetical protein